MYGLLCSMLYLNECIYVHTSLLKNLVVYVTTLLPTNYASVAVAQPI